MDPHFTWGVFSEALISCQQRFVGVALTDPYNIASHFEQPMSSIEWVISKSCSHQPIGGFHAISGDTNNNGEMNKCWWKNKTS